MWNAISADSHSLWTTLWWEFCLYLRNFTPVFIKILCHYRSPIFSPICQDNSNILSATSKISPLSPIFWVTIMKCHVCCEGYRKISELLAVLLGGRYIGDIVGSSAYRRSISVIFLRVKKIGVTDIDDIFGRSTYQTYWHYFESEYIQLHKIL